MEEDVHGGFHCLSGHVSQFWDGASDGESTVNEGKATFLRDVAADGTDTAVVGGLNIQGRRGVPKKPPGLPNR